MISQERSETFLSDGREVKVELVYFPRVRPRRVVFWFPVRKGEALERRRWKGRVR